MKLKPAKFTMTRQGVRDLDRVEGPIIPASGGPVPTHKIPNVGDTERTASTVAGTALLALGAAKMSKGGLLLGLAGAALLHRGLTGHCEMYHMLGVSTADKSKAPTEMAYLNG